MCFTTQLGQLAHSSVPARENPRPAVRVRDRRRDEMGTVVSVFGVEPFRIGGAETYARELSVQLEKLGWRSVVCFLSEPPDEVRKFLTLPNVTVEVAEDFTELNWKGTRGIARILRRYRPDILHLYFTSFLGIYPWLAKVFLVNQVFFTDQTSRPAGYAPQRADWWKRVAVRVINYPMTREICVSEYGRRCLATLDLLPSSRYELIYNAVDLTRIESRGDRRSAFCLRYGIPEDRVVVVQVSWIIPEKGIPQLLKVARLVVSRSANVQFVVVGEGAYREKYMREAAELGLADHITWTGLVQDPFGEGVYHAADIICQLSQWEEVFGWMIAEGMAHGKPIVGTKVGGIPELIEDGHSGYLVDRNDLDSIADKIEKLAADPELRQQMGKAGIERVAENFNLKRNVTQLIGAYSISSD